MESKEFVLFLLDALKILLVALAIVIPIRWLLFQPFIVKGGSMEPNYHSGDYLIVDELSYKMRTPEREEVIVFKYPLSPSVKYIKRIIGLPNETIEIKNGEIYITQPGKTESEKINEDLYISNKTRAAWLNGLNYGPLKLGKDEYFVMGDNRNYSSDSRKWGVLPKNDMVGRILLRFSPYDVLYNIASQQQPSLVNNNYE